MIDNNKNDNIKYSLIDIKLLSIFKSIDIRSLIINRLELPNEEFENFMKLLTKWNLSNTCGSNILKFA